MCFCRPGHPYIHLLLTSLLQLSLISHAYHILARFLFLRRSISDPLEDSGDQTNRVDGFFTRQTKSAAVGLDLRTRQGQMDHTSS